MVIKEINNSKEWDKKGDWGSHLPLLWLALENTKGTVVEIGSGEISTPLIRKYCGTNVAEMYLDSNGNNDFSSLKVVREKRDFFSFDSNKEWCNKTKSTYIECWDKSDKWVIPCSLVFIDEAPGEHRKESILKYKDLSDVLVMHDTEIGAEYVYKMGEILSTFKYRIDYEPVGCYPRTTAVSNFIDVTKWVK